jgi:signal transduction histidine kinase
VGRQAPFRPSLRSPMTRTSSFIRLLRSGSVRIALSYALVFIVSTMLLVGYLWWQTTNYLERETDAVIVADTRAIGDRLRDFGLPGALDAINDRLKRAADEHAIYLLTDPLMTPVGGNLSAWPAQVGRDPGWYEIKIVQDGKLHATRVLNVDLPADFHLLVGRDIQDRAAIRDVILNGLAWAAFAALVLAVAGGIMVRRAVFKRVETINRTAAAIVQGDLARRVPTTHSADEFDQLSGTINEMLDQIQLLIEGTRGASDAVAHDLRTPLAEMRGRLEALLRSRPAADQTFEEVGKTIGDIDRLIAVFNALLRLADIRSGVRRSGFRDVELDRILAEVAEFYEPMAEEKSITLDPGALQPTVVKGDPDLLAQAIGNLLDNAIKYSPAGSKVSLGLTRLPERMLRLEVRDHGPGIPQGERDVVTRQFYRGSQSDVPGTGLGLSLVLAVAHLHGGHLELSDNDPGLVAALILPLPNGAPGELRASTLAKSL